jgi:hypothetical protein
VRSEPLESLASALRVGHGNQRAQFSPYCLQPLGAFTNSEEFLSTSRLSLAAFGVSLLGHPGEGVLAVDRRANLRHPALGRELI